MNRTVLAIGIIFVLIGASVVSSNSLYTDKSQISAFKSNESQSISLINNDLKVTLETDNESYGIGEPIEVTIFVTNTGEEDITAVFPDTQKADFWVDWGDVYLWSADKYFAQVLTPVEIPSGETIEMFSRNWEQVDYGGNQVPSGEYWIEGWMVESSYNSYPIFSNSVTIIIGNHPPEPPTITGPQPKPGMNLVYTLNAVDPDGDDVSYFIDWGDGNSSGWSYYVQSGTDYAFVHKWDVKPKFIRAKAKDIYEAESDWAYWYFRDKSSNLELNNINKEEDCDCQEVSEIELERGKITTCIILFFRRFRFGLSYAFFTSLSVMFRQLGLPLLEKICLNLVDEYMDKSDEIWKLAVDYDCFWTYFGY